MEEVFYVKRFKKIIRFLLDGKRGKNNPQKRRVMFHPCISRGTILLRRRKRGKRREVFL